jgi:cyclomaltodextrinase
MFPFAALAIQSEFDSRAHDWTLGPVVYQVFVDRFAEGIPMAKKRGAYGSPKVVKAWSELPQPGQQGAQVWSHELEFWGGDLPGVRNKLDYIQGVGADAVYLTPIFKALTNHKYDTQDYLSIAPEFGSMSDLQGLIQDVHARKMKLMLDGVFNHMGRTSDKFQSAFNDPRSPFRSWFGIGKQYAGGYQAWASVPNLPALNLENPAVRSYLWNSPNSVVQSYLKRGIDGWRLDVAFELGPTYLQELTHAAHIAKQGSPVVGEISGYPSDWFPAVDGVFDFYSMNVCERMLGGEISGRDASGMLSDMVADAGLKNLLRSWLLVDNHDTPRFADQMPDWQMRKLVFALQFSLPGAPVVYYGTELGMKGPGDPANRAPMPWNSVSGNQTLAWIKKLTSIRRKFPSLRYGDVKFLSTRRLLGFARTTDKLRQSMIILVNPTSDTVREVVPTRIGRIMSWGDMRDVLTGKSVKSVNGVLDLTLGPRSVMMLSPATGGPNSPYRRVP